MRLEFFMLEDDIYVTNNFICKSDPSQGSLDAWNRLKKELEELSKTPTNKQRTPCRECEACMHEECLTCKKGSNYRFD